MVEITYNATLTSDATLNDNANVNDVTLNYTRDSKTNGNDGSDNDKTYTYTFDIDGAATGTTGIINKKGDKATDTEGLNDATFALYKAEQVILIRQQLLKHRVTKKVSFTLQVLPQVHTTFRKQQLQTVIL